MIQYIQYYPNVKLLIGLFVVFGLDFGFGVAKATFNGTRRTSKGFRQTFSKFMQYGGSIIVAMVLLNIIYDSNAVFGKQLSLLFGDLMLYIMIYIEVVSILENMEEISPESDFVIYFIRPVRRIITFQIKNLLREENQKIENENNFNNTP